MIEFKVRNALAISPARPRQHFAYADSPDVLELASVYTAAIVQNHPFVDGQQATGFVIGVLFLELNGYRFVAMEEEAAQPVVQLASGDLDHAAYAAFLRANSVLSAS